MSTCIINYHSTRKESHIFVGVNALRQAVYFDEMGTHCTDQDELYNMQKGWALLRGMCWGDVAKTALPVDKEQLLGNGNHAKIYETRRGSLLFSSQNNGNSPLFEFCILYKDCRGGKLSKFTERMFKYCAKYQTWFTANKKDFRAVAKIGMGRQ